MTAGITNSRQVWERLLRRVAWLEVNCALVERMVGYVCYGGVEATHKVLRVLR